jgi:hypothetical protein
MQAFVFSFTGDASGSADPITLPANFPNGVTQIQVRPPIGHAWTFYEVAGGTGCPMQMDESLTVTREPGKGCFLAGEIIGAVALDTGSGTFYGLAQ